MKKLLLLLLSVMTLFVAAQDAKKVAILETVDKVGDVPYGIKLQVRTSMTYAISHTPGYEGYDRVDVESILGEQNFQRTGLVSDDQIKKLGELTGAQYVLIAEAAVYDEQNIIITAKVLDVETGGVTNSAPPAFASKEPRKMQEACVTLANKLLGGNVIASQTTTHAPSPQQVSPSNGKNIMDISGWEYTEDAFGLNMKMAWVEGGEFVMGCSDEQSNCQGDEKPVRKITLDGYYISTLEVTQAQWKKVMGVNIEEQVKSAVPEQEEFHDYISGSSGDDYPVFCVSWNDATEFCRLLSKETGKTYMLPTEAQWEYAARGGNKPDGTLYAGSGTIETVAWIYLNSPKNLQPCGLKRPNSLGIYDMSGNVSEWCQDWYSKYDVNETRNPVGPTKMNARVVRGGSVMKLKQACRVSARHRLAPWMRPLDTGFRVVCIP